MDRALQERLVGAAVLVALGVWLIPWVLDGSSQVERPDTQAIALKLPAPEDAGDTVLRRQTIELSGNRGAALKTGADEAVPAGRAAEQTSAPAPESQPSENSVAQSSMPARTATTASAQAEDQMPTQTPARAPAEPAGATAAVTTATEPEAQTPQPDIIPATPVAGWMVQLGSFSDAGNARRQAQRVGTYGQSPKIYEFAAAGGRTMFRVRLGPLETRERAQAAASSLAAHGFVAQLVAPE
jgi:DedD protein